MQFSDGNRIDLTFRPLAESPSISRNCLSLVLLDKDKRFNLPAPPLLAYLPRKPTAKPLADCCNKYG